MNVDYSLQKQEFMIQTKKGEQTMREFYIDARKENRISISKLQMDSGLSHPTLYSLEKRRNPNAKLNNSIRSMLIALLAMGYRMEVEG